VKEELQRLVESIKEKTGKTQEDIAIEMGYKKNYISEMLSPKGKVTDKFMAAIKLRFSEVLKLKNQEDNESLSIVNEDPAEYNTALPLGDLKVTLKDYIELWQKMYAKEEERGNELLLIIKDLAKGQKEINEVLKPIKENVIAIKSNSETIQSDLEVLTGVVRSDDEVLLKGTDRILGREEGASSTEAGIGERAFLDSNKEDHKIDSNDKLGNSGKGRRQRKA
jgi:hypothetical protein